MAEEYVVMIGYNTVDEYYSTDHYPALGDKAFTRFIKAVPGGIIPNAAAVIGSLGTKNYILDAIGGDAYQEMILAEMHKYRVNTDYVEILDGISNNKTHIILSGGEKTIFVIENPDKRFILLDERKQALLNDAAYVYTLIHNLKAIDGYKQMVDKFCSNGTRLVLDVETTTFVGREEDAYFFEKASIVYFNEFSFEKYSQGLGEAALNQLVQGTDKIVVITMGAAGARIKTAHEDFHMPAYQVEPVDTTGAGDTFNVSFLYGVMHAWPLRDCAAFATAAAARCIMDFGPRTGAAAPDQIYQFMQQYGGKT